MFVKLLCFTNSPRLLIQDLKSFFGVTLVASVLIQQNIFVKAKLAFAGEEKQDRYTICLSGKFML